jgi:hypothetical protein
MPRILTRQMRGAGEFVTQSVEVPARLNDEANKFTLSLDMPAADLADPDLVIDLALEGSTDGGNTWRTVAESKGWTGGLVDRLGNPVPPRLGWSASDNRLLTHARLRWNLSRACRIGATLDATRIDARSLG